MGALRLDDQVVAAEHFARLAQGKSSTGEFRFRNEGDDRAATREQLAIGEVKRPAGERPFAAPSRARWSHGAQQHADVDRSEMGSIA